MNLNAFPLCIAEMQRKNYPPSKFKTNQAIIDGLQKLINEERESSYGGKHMRATLCKVSKGMLILLFLI